MKRLVAACLAGVLCGGCVSMPVNLSQPPNLLEGRDYTVLGEGEGSAVGIMLFNLIPINQNQRFQNAYDEAVRSKGGDRLLNPQDYGVKSLLLTIKGVTLQECMVRPS